MKRRWRSGFYFEPQDPVYPIGRWTPPDLCKRAAYLRTGTLDDWYNPGLGKLVGRITERVQFDVVIAEYIFNSRCLMFAPSDTLKLIDVHDIFTNRHMLFGDTKEDHEFLTTTHLEEGEALDRADALLAITEADAVGLSSLSKRPNVVVGSIPRKISTKFLHIRTIRERTMLYMGANNQGNRIGLDWFLTEVLPRVYRKVADARLLLAGGICHHYASCPEVTLLGELPRANSALTRSAVFVSPHLVGPGLAMKNIMAMAAGCPLVTTTSGMCGLESGVGLAFMASSNPEEFAEFVSILLLDERTRMCMSIEGMKWVSSYRSENLNKLQALILRESPVLS